MKKQNILFFAIISLLISVLLSDYSYALQSNPKFSRSLIQKEDDQGGQAGSRIQSPDTSQGMAGELLKRSFVYRGNPRKAFLISLFIPGLGQRYVKSRKAVRFFAAVEIALWGTMIGHNLSAKWAKKNYKAFAINHALADIKGKDSQFFVDIGNFPDIYQYNHKKRVDRKDDAVYEETSENFWEWDSEENRKYFKKMRIDADATKNRATYFGVGIMINHLISAIHAALVARQGKPIDEAHSNPPLHVTIIDNPNTSSPTIIATYTKQW